MPPVEPLKRLEEEMFNLLKNPLLLPEESDEKSKSPQKTSHRIHGTGIYGIFTCIYPVINVG